MTQNNSTGLDQTLARMLVVAQIVSILAIPIVLALVGFWVQQSLQDQQIKRDYVNLAVSLLLPKKEGEQEPPRELRKWAAELLSNSSPVKLTDDQLIAIERGGLRLKPGDLLFFNVSGKRHEGIYLGDDDFIRSIRAGDESNPLHKPSK
ncbi:cell wall-associated NlpC family hydrolase [Pseudomonas sp. JUb42]|uniref:NlpC/P60 family protein n=1 Tax=Pseudomonas sp. JUb42 TaxID=2940611 RepID=UPI0038F6B7D5|nr:cell wall-associated NlpC family hydrolase [Pseudomonas sp. JUb42]